VLQVIDLKKRFGDREAVCDISFTVNKGECFGLLGPNGAGKSTTISIISGLLASDHGDVEIDGISVKKNPMAIKKKIGVVPQDIALYPTLSAKENLFFWGRMYGLRGAMLKERVDEVLEIVGLADRSKERIDRYSGGMKRRINIGAALLHQPAYLIMDEPTVGIDPQSRNHILETVKELNKQGMTVIYTSHYMEEVEFLCERIAIIDHGKLIALGSKEELYRYLVGGTSIRVVTSGVRESWLAKLKESADVQNIVVQNDTVILSTSNKQELIHQVIATAMDDNVEIQTLDIQEPNLEAVFLHLTGRSLRD
jgi:ABC-2 type transport system ATP-binding protein